MLKMLNNSTRINLKNLTIQS